MEGSKAAKGERKIGRKRGVYLFLFYLSYNIEKKETRKMKAMISSSIPVRLHQAKWQKRYRNGHITWLKGRGKANIW